MIDSVIETKSITDSSHECHNNSLFFMINGNNDNGENYFIDAYNKGCRHFVIDETSMFETNLNVFIYKVNDILEYYNNLLLKQNAEIFKKIKIIGVTGTNGKTTTTTLTYQVLKKYYNVILMGTNGTFVYCKKKEHHLNTINTTPKLSTIIKILNDYPHTEVLILEVSSEAILYKRIGNLLFDIIGLTNIGHDHLNSHKTINNYLECKKSLLKKFKNNKGVFIVNNDDTMFPLNMFIDDWFTVLEDRRKVC